MVELLSVMLLVQLVVALATATLLSSRRLDIVGNTITERDTQPAPALSCHHLLGLSVVFTVVHLQSNVSLLLSLLLVHV